MKKCPHCNREYSGGIETCPIDEHALIPFAPPTRLQTQRPAPTANTSKGKSKTTRSPFVTRISRLAATWFLASIAGGLALGPEKFRNFFDLFIAAILFPVGLGYFIPQGMCGLAALWLVYLALTGAALCAGNREAYVATYTILCVLLLLNVAGCYLSGAKL